MSKIGDLAALHSELNPGCDRDVEPVQHVKFGGPTWLYKIVTAPNVPDWTGAVASKPL